MADVRHPREILQCRAMSPDEFQKFRETTVQQMEKLVTGMDFAHVVYAVGAVVSLMAAELPAPVVQAFMDRARAEALKATPDQLAAGR